MLASDVDNTAFVGAQNPDAALIVSFYLRPVQNNFETSKQGRPIFEDICYVKINVPGLKEMEVDTPARSDHQRRFPLQYQHFVNRTQGDAREIGTPIAEWPQLTRSQAEELRGIKFYTIESIAGASDANINALGMIGGMAPYSLREKARAFLHAAKDSALPQHQAEELAKAHAEISMLKEQFARFAESSKVNAAPQVPALPASPPLSQEQPAVAAPIPVGVPASTPKKRGRPSKADIAARAAVG